MGVAWGLVSGSALVKHTSKVFGVPRRLLGALMLDIRSPEPSAHSPSHHRPRSSELRQEHWAVFAATLGLRMARPCHSLTAVWPQGTSRLPPGPPIPHSMRGSDNLGH